MMRVKESEQLTNIFGIANTTTTNPENSEKNPKMICKPKKFPPARRLLYSVQCASTTL